ncbi:c-type cytochrome [Moheibacter sp.]|uniref:c-type cytochrome n=1 Tax=Moheibacter sp. TaxID=1965316 RepID=UPI003C769BBB
MKARPFYKLQFLNLAVFLAIFTFSYSQDEITGDGAKGYELFQANCTACHQIDGTLIGPQIRGVVDRVKEEGGVGREWLHAWIKDNKALRESGDAYANKVYEQYNRQEMLSFPSLSDQDIDDILTFSMNPEAGQEAFEKAKADAKAAAEAAKAAKSSGGGASSGIVIVGFFILSVLLIWILIRLNALVKLTRAEELAPDDEEVAFSFAEFINKYDKVFKLSLIALLFLTLFGLWKFMLGIGVDKGYEPEQPIYFSHQIHAGVQGIDCQYCHSSAKYGKVSGIPSPNLCMNCHKTIKEYKGDYYEEHLVESGRFASADDVKEFYTGEIQKMYKSIGWDPATNSFTGEQRPIEWVRIHNMPDFVYFSHQQHVVAGEKAILQAIADGTIPNAKELNLPGNSQVCFACHGDVTKMDELKMANQFTMGWCIECHRTTEVDMSNEYNSQYYAELHEKLKKEYGDGAKITVDAIGGLECGKCHY